MKKSKFIKEVLIELEGIKARATKEEINRLNFDHRKPAYCIYGQMTGTCNSDRAIEIYGKNYEEISREYNEDLVIFDKQDFSKGNWFTALEKYLFMVEAPVHEEIIKFLKGEVETIKLD